MKFAKELEQDLVPEWRAKYLDYKLCKKKVKAVARAFRSLNQTPRTPGRRRPANLFSSASYQLPIQNQTRSPFAFEGSLDDTLLNTNESEQTPIGSSRNGKTLSGLSQGVSSVNSTRNNYGYHNKTVPSTIIEHRPLKDYDDDLQSSWDSGAVTNYGSIIASPPNRTTVAPPMLALPDPAIPPDTESFPKHNRAWRHSNLRHEDTPLVPRPANIAGGAYEVGRRFTPSKLGGSLLKHRNILRGRRTFSMPPQQSAPPQGSPFLRRMFTSTGGSSVSSPDFPLEAYRDFDLRQADFFAFLDSELEKIEAFYKMKETEASERLLVLRQQLHEMRDRRLEEVAAAQKAKERVHREQERLHAAKGRQTREEVIESLKDRSLSSGLRWIKPIEQAIGVGSYQFGKNTRALEHLGSPSGPVARQFPEQRHDSWRDFTRRPTHPDEIPYRVAKRKLKLALQEYYRGLELLKAYALLNRTAFRKINKKYDKAVNARPTGRYVLEKVNKAWFVQSEVLDGHIVAVEDLYARYFEGGNHKIAVGKLRVKQMRRDHYNSSVFRNGLLLAAGLILGIQGIVYGTEHLYDPDPTVQLDTSYLLQIYAGYFLGLLLFLLFCIDCSIWQLAKINYVFIFEFDTRHNLDWRQLSELPCFFLFLEGLFLWLNFQQSHADNMYLYWPVILIGLTVIVMFFPGPILYHRSREWWAYSNFRLLLAGLYPVEFRDFFLGDMYCSQTYAMGNLELFFCLYAQGWSNPGQCNSTSSRLLGFFSTLPGIWRALQCLRRYYDTRNAFPHLVNCGKYMFTILFYMSLSLYRIDRTVATEAFFIACATVNSIYTSVWDVAMDWSLCNPYAKNPFLRDVLGYKRPWVYYSAMVVDPILRFNWIFYAIFESELQHSAILSFIVSLSEVCRRAMWTLFRVENEHCTNVGRFRASRDVPLPYEIPAEDQEEIETGHETRSSHPEQEVQLDSQDPEPQYQPRPRTRAGDDLEQATTGSSAASPGTIRRRRTLPPLPSDSPMQRGIARVGTIISAAHAQDFERKRRPGVSADNNKQPVLQHESVGSSDEDELEAEDPENEQDALDVSAILERRHSATEGG